VYAVIKVYALHKPKNSIALSAYPSLRVFGEQHWCPVSTVSDSVIGYIGADELDI